MTPNALLQEGLAAHERGWALIPLEGKIPTIKDWTHAQRPSEAEIREWCAASSNIGVRTGAASGIVVIDADGGSSVAELDLPETPTVITGGGGRHYFYRINGGPPIGNSAGKLAPHVDVRGDGGQVVLAGSIHPDTGAIYRWAPDLSPDDLPLADLPAHIVERLLPKPKPLPSTTPAATASNGYARAALDAEIAAVRNAPAHEGNDQLNRAAFSLGQLVGAGLLAEADVSEALLAAATPRRPETEAAATIRSGLAAGKLEPRTAPAIRSELGNAEELVREHGRDFRHVVSWVKDLVWDGARFKLDETGETRRWAKQTARARTVRAAAAGDKEGISFAIRSESARGIAATLELARTEPGVAIEPAVLDRDPWILNTLSGTVDLRSGELRPHRREDMLTKIAPVDFDPTATAPAWDSFLDRVLPDADVRAFVQRFLGYALTGDVSEQVLAFGYGLGQNGKSTLLTTIQNILGDYAVQAPSDLLLASHGQRHPTELTTLHGRRLAVYIEAGEGRALAETLVKSLTGADMISARRMREDFWTFLPTHKIILAANHKPAVRGTDLAIWRRILLVPFNVVIPEAERDRKLPEKLIAESPGILRWLVAGCLDWQRNGLNPPAAVKSATEKYRQDQDVIGGFLEDRCTIKPELKAHLFVPKGELHKAYLDWAREQGDSDPLLMRAFGEKMRERGFEEDRHGDARTRIWRGIGLLAPPDESARP